MINIMTNFRSLLRLLENYEKTISVTEQALVLAEKVGSRQDKAC